MHEGVVDRVTNQYGTHGDNAVGQSLGCRDDVRRYFETLCAETVAKATECRDDLVENKQDSVLVTDLPQSFQIARWRWYDTGRAGNRLNDYGR